MIMRAEGEKVKDDPTLLKKVLKKGKLRSEFFFLILFRFRRLSKRRKRRSKNRKLIGLQRRRNKVSALFLFFACFF